MAMPTIITVKGTYLKVDGTPETGSVKFLSKVYVLYSVDEFAVVPSYKEVALESDGSFEITLPASNDPAWTPVGWKYHVILRLSGDSSSFDTVVPYNAPGGIVFISDLLPVSAGGSGLYASYSHTHTGFVTEANVETIVEDVVSTELANYALVSHTHAASAIISGTIAIARLPVGVASNQVAAGDHTHNYDAVYAPLVHTHAYADITGTPTLNKAAVGLANVDNTADVDKPISTATQTALDLKANLASPTFTGTVSGISKAMIGLANVDNTSDASKPVSTSQQTALDLKAPLASPAFTGTPTGITKVHVGLGNVDNTSDASKPVSTAQQTALDLKANLASPTFTGTVGGITKSMVGLGNVDNTADTAKPVSSAQQAALDLKAPIASPTFTGTVSGVTKSMVGLGSVDNTSDAAKPVSTATQTALDLKAPLASPTFTGTVSGITKSMVGLANVDNTADTAKPVSTAQQTALDLKANLASPTFTGTVSGITKSMVGLGNVDNTSDVNKPVSTAQAVADNANVRAIDHGLGGWTFDPVQVQGALVLATAGLSYVVRLRVMTGVVTNIHFHFTVAGSGLTSGQCFASLHNDAGAILGAGAVTADQATNWASGGYKTCALTVAQGVTAGDWYKIRFWFNGTTGPTLSRGVNSSSAITNAGLSAPNFRFSTADTGLTTSAGAPGNIGTMTGGATAWWVAVS
jgi:hypothetical protein